MNEKKSGFWDELEENIMLIPLAIAVVLSLVTFILQKFLSSETTNTMLQASYYAYAWMASFGLAVCARKGSHIRVAVFDKVYPEKVKAILDLLCDLVGFVVMVILLYFSFKMVSSALAEGAVNSKAPALPLWIAYLAPVCGVTFACVRTVVRLIKGGGQ